MMLPQHEIPMTTAITASAPGKGGLLQGLYRLCMDLFNNVEESRTSTVTKVRTVHEGVVTAVVTDNATGLFLQLTGADAVGKPKEGPYLTFGKKFLEESKNAQLSNTAVKLWR